MNTIKLPPREPKDTGHSESEIQTMIRAAIGSHPRCRLWRNNTGTLPDRRGIPVKFGLCLGSSDLIGIVRMELQDTHGPRIVGRFFALEVKDAKGKTTPEQDMFLAVIRSMGGFGAVVRSVGEAVAALERCLKGASE